MYQIKWDSRGVIGEFQGFVTGAEYLDLLNKIFADPRFDELHYLISDFAKANGHNLADSEIEELAAFCWASTLSNKRIRHVIIVKDPAVRSAVSRLKSSSENLCHIFSDMERARQWLAVSS